MISTTDSITIIAFTALCTFLTRVLPFLIFSNKKEPPAFVKYLGKVLPMSVIAILVVYCLKDISFSNVGGWIPSVISVIAVVLIHIWKRNNLLSIGSGTLLYMLLVQFIF